MRKIICITFLTFSLINFGFSQNEEIKSLVKKTNELNLDMWDLTTFAEKHIKDKKQLARFFYYWIGSNIKYDTETYQKIVNGTIDNNKFWEKQDEFVVYKNRTGVCAGYAKLYQWFLDWVDIETVIISGHIRDERNHYVEIESDDIYRHAWNAIKLDNKWLLVDTTWGTSNQSETSEFYFNMLPERAIITHFPEDNKWQLLDKPLTIKEFNNSKYISPLWFFVGFSDIPKLMADENYYYFVFKNNPNSEWSVNLKYSSNNLKFEPVPDIKSIVKDDHTYYRFNQDKIPAKTYFKVNLTKITTNENGFSTLEYNDVINLKR